jgi:hypothetical protein
LEIKPIAFLLISLICLLLSFAYSFFYPSPNFLGAVPFVLVILAFFFFGAMAFGYFAFIPHVFYGLAMGANKNAAIFLFFVPLAMATYAGTTLGCALEKDFKIKKYFLTEGKVVIILLIVSIVFAIIAEIALPAIVNMWPSDLFGLNVKPGEGIFDIIGDLSRLIIK